MDAIICQKMKISTLIGLLNEKIVITGGLDIFGTELCKIYSVLVEMIK